MGEHANANNVETQKAIKKYQIQIRDAQGKLEEESRGKGLGHDQLVNADRRATEQELSDANEALSDATVMNQSVAAAKRKLEAEMQTLNADLDEMQAEAKLCEEKAAKAMVDAARLAE